MEWRSHLMERSRSVFMTTNKHWNHWKFVHNRSYQSLNEAWSPSLRNINTRYHDRPFFFASIDLEVTRFPFISFNATWNGVSRRPSPLSADRSTDRYRSIFRGHRSGGRHKRASFLLLWIVTGRHWIPEACSTPSSARGLYTHSNGGGGLYFVLIKFYNSKVGREISGWRNWIW